MSDTEIDQLKSDFYNFISMAKFLSDNLINIEGEIIVVEEAVTHVREDGWGNNSIWLSPQDASDEILPLINKYDSFICTWHKGDIYALGLGYGYRTWINDIPIGYAVITEMNAGDERQRVFLHELLHGVVQYYGLDVNLPDHPEWSGNSYDTSESTKKFFKYIMTQCISPEKYQTSIRKNASEKKPAYDKDFEFLKGKIK
jgi:hypothetical protein